ncbi:MAG: prepilin peptidase [Candidatus Hydrogenedentes bacterium]|nr:prepilin peptidase [Candidatus Hydrogenedentota bacterium]
MAIVPSDKWLMLEQRITDRSLPKGLDALWDRAGGFITRFTPRQRRCLNRAEQVLALENRFSTMIDAKLREAAYSLRDTFRLGRDTPDDLLTAFAVIRETAEREIGQRPYLVQVAGAFALYDGCVAEMATGEGKTLTATMPATVIGWRGRGCHIVTVNDYLAKRDAEWMRKIYRSCGLSVAHIEQATEPDGRREAYMADVTYCTNKEVSADFLRDRLILGKIKGLAQALLDKMDGSRKPIIDALVQRGLEFVIVDEADSVLIDEAVTPLIISGLGSNPGETKTFCAAASMAGQMSPETDYQIKPRYREIELTDSGRELLRRQSAALGGVWAGSRRSEEMILRALTAKEFYQRDHHYIVDDGEVVIVDEFTGRIMPDRQWRDGLHQAVEAKENLEVTPPKETLARISFQRFFRLYRNCAGMTGTGREATAEFWQIYHLPVVIIPTNRPCVRKLLPDTVFAKADEKWKHILTAIKRVHSSGRPILIGTPSVKASEHLSDLLKAEDLDHQLLNAVRHREEAQIVAGAGQQGKITIATNMAGRGTDIVLGRGVAELGGLHVIAAERNESGRIDRQLFGRCARQGNPGSAQAIVSLEDNYVSRYGGNLLRYLKKRYSHTERNIRSGTTAGAFRFSQYQAEKLALRQRISVMKSDHWLDEHLSFAGKE